MDVSAGNKGFEARVRTSFARQRVMRDAVLLSAVILALFALAPCARASEGAGPAVVYVEGLAAHSGEYAFYVFRPPANGGAESAEPNWARVEARQTAESGDTGVRINAPPKTGVLGELRLVAVRRDLAEKSPAGIAAWFRGQTPGVIPVAGTDRGRAAAPVPRLAGVALPRGQDGRRVRSDPPQSGAIGPGAAAGLGTGQSDAAAQRRTGRGVNRTSSGSGWLRWPRSWPWAPSGGGAEAPRARPNQSHDARTAKLFRSADMRSRRISPRLLTQSAKQVPETMGSPTRARQARTQGQTCEAPSSCRQENTLMTVAAGNEGFEARVRASFARQRVMETLGAVMTRVEPGSVEIVLPYRADLTQQHGFIHAGIAATILDSACGYAAFSLMPADVAVLTVEYKINLLRPAKGERLIARGRVVRSGKTLTVCCGRCIRSRGRPGERGRHHALDDHGRAATG